MRQKLDTKRLGRIEANIGGNPEDVHLSEFGRAGKRNPSQTTMITIAKANRDVVLDQNDAIENAASHIARPLERIQPPTDDGDGAFAGRPAAGGGERL